MTHQSVTAESPTADAFNSRNAAVAHSRRCLRCSKPLSRRARADAKYCSTACRIRHWHRRRRTARALTRKPKCSCGKRLAITRRADALYCSTRCRQHGYRQRRAAAATAMPRKAHQRVIRERLAAADPNGGRSLDISKATVRPITTAEAKAIIEQYEWLGTMPAVSRYCFGLFFDGRCGGAVVFGDEYGAKSRCLAALWLRRKTDRVVARGLRALGASAFGEQADPPLDGLAPAEICGRDGDGGRQRGRDRHDLSSGWIRFRGRCGAPQAAARLFGSTASTYPSGRPDGWPGRKGRARSHGSASMRSPFRGGRAISRFAAIATNASAIPARSPT